MTPQKRKKSEAEDDEALLETIDSDRQEEIFWL